MKAQNIVSSVADNKAVSTPKTSKKAKQPKAELAILTPFLCRVGGKLKVDTKTLTAAVQALAACEKTTTGETLAAAYKAVVKCLAACDKLVVKQDDTKRLSVLVESEVGSLARFARCKYSENSIVLCNPVVHGIQEKGKVTVWKLAPTKPAESLQKLNAVFSGLFTV